MSYSVNYDTSQLCVSYLYFLLLFFFFPDKTEIPVFVELASISAGENDIDIDKLLFFRDSMAASAPIIFDLRSTSGFEEFSAALLFINETISKDNNLPKKLVSLQIPCSKITWTHIRSMNCQSLVSQPRGLKTAKCT